MSLRFLFGAGVMNFFFLSLLILEIVIPTQVLILTWVCWPDPSFVLTWLPTEYKVNVDRQKIEKKNAPGVLKSN